MTSSPHETADATHALVQWLRSRQEEAAQLLQELIAIPTENPPGANLLACVDLLEGQLQDSGLRCVRVACKRSDTLDSGAQRARLGEPGEDRVALLAEYGEESRTLHFHGHYDVVPAQSHDQFHPVRKGRFLFGRGACDMKGGIVSMLYAIRALQATGARLNGKIALTLVPDEETGGARGSASLARNGQLGRAGIGMLTAEPTSGVVWNANRGAITLRVTVFGKSAHVGLQHRGENAFESMHEVVKRAQQLKREVEARNTNCNVGGGQTHNSILLIGGQSAGGTNFNVVPDKCWFTIDRRVNPEENLAEEKSRLVEVLERCKREGVPLEWTILQEGESGTSSEGEPLAKVLGRNVQAVTGAAPAFEMCPGLLETRFYAAMGMPSYAYGPGLLSVAHGPDEYVDLDRVTECAAIYALTALDVLS